MSEKRGSNEHDPVPAELLGRVHRLIDPFDERGYVFFGMVAAAADTDGHVYTGVGSWLERGQFECLPESFCDHPGFFRFGLGENHDELLPPVAIGGVDPPDPLPDDIGQFCQYPITIDMAVGV